MENKFGEKVKEIRKKAGLNQDEFAKESNKSLTSTLNFLINNSSLS